MNSQNGFIGGTQKKEWWEQLLNEDPNTQAIIISVSLLFAFTLIYLRSLGNSPAVLASSSQVNKQDNKEEEENKGDEKNIVDDNNKDDEKKSDEDISKKKKPLKVE